MSRTQVSGHFLDGAGGPLAVVLWEPPVGVSGRFAALYVAPFGDEMNKSRRMAAMQARAFAAAGGTVALLDLRGTGDSAGDHAQGTWLGWHGDVAVAWQWLATRAGMPGVLWGLRTGALLAADVVAKGLVSPAALVLWQPVAGGRGFFNQFLRLAGLRQRIEGEATPADSQAARKALAAGNAIEVAGYEIDPKLVAEAEAVELAKLDVARCRVVLREVVPDAAPSLSPFAAGVVQRWRKDGVDVDARAVSGPSFWLSQEIAEAPQLVEATTSAVVSTLATPVGVAS
ncbi:MAG: hydrolase 2, exosortase A system-associated [Burkholderiales bacterium]|nr:hydrolase 2, exosortase A system-associated [Burkholderiales bacterium]